MNNLAPMKNCPGGMQGNLNWMPGYMEVCENFSTRIDFTSNLVMPLDFADMNNNENMSKGITCRTHQALQLLYFDLFLMK